MTNDDSNLNVQVSSFVIRASSFARGAWAVGDQGLFAGSNFLLTILLARWLAEAAYGAFAVALAVLFFLGSIHMALLGEPLLVFGAGRFAGRRRAYLGAVTAGHWLVSGVVAVLMLLAGGMAWAVGVVELGVALVGLGLSAPFVLLMWLGRRACYLVGRVHWAAGAGAVYLVLIVLGLGVLHARGAVTLVGAVVVIGVSSAVAGGMLALVLRLHQKEREGAGVWGEMVREHLRYGRWSASTNVMFFLSGHVFFVLAGLLAGLEATGLLRAMVNLVMPMNLVSIALATLLVPALVRAESGEERRRRVGWSVALLCAGAVVYWVLLGVFHRPVFEVVYAGRYVPGAAAVWVLGALLVTMSLGDVLSAALRASERPDLVFRAFAASAVVAVGLGVPLIVWWGVMGAVVAMVGAGVMSAGVLGWYVWGKQ
jgi:O-antigen/teichoic acid export membrane protein